MMKTVRAERLMGCAMNGAAIVGWNKFLPRKACNRVMGGDHWTPSHVHQKPSRMLDDQRLWMMMVHSYPEQR